MEIPLLITKADFESDKLIPKMTDEPRVDRCIREAQKQELGELMGDALLSDLLKNSTADKYKKLLDGDEYTVNSNTILFAGLKMALKYWTYARYISQQKVNVGTHGVNIKKNENSEPVEDKTIANEVADARQMAQLYWHDTVKYLAAKGKTVYPLWNVAVGTEGGESCATPDSSETGGVRIWAI